jgi:hypothetical protein
MPPNPPQIMASVAVGSLAHRFPPSRDRERCGQEAGCISRHCEEPCDEAIHLAEQSKLDCFAALAMTLIDRRLRSRGAMRPRFARQVSRTSKSEGAGNAGCALHPRSRVQNRPKKAHTSIQGSGGDPTFPAQWLYGLYRAHPGVSGFPASVASRIWPPEPGWDDRPPRDLTPTIEASGPHDFTVRAAPFVSVPYDRSRETRPAITCRA